jgi:hypothetical protein
VKKDVGSSKTSTEVKKPTGVKIKTEIEPSKPKVNKSSLDSISLFYFNSEFNLIFKISLLPSEPKTE